VAKYFDKEITDPKSLGNAADQIAREVRLQVQRVPSGSDVTSISGSLCVYTAEFATETLYTHMVDPTHIHTVLERGKHVPQEKADRLIEAIVEMVDHPDNLLTNKASLIKCLGIAVELGSETTLNKLMDVLSPLACGSVDEPNHLMTTEEAANPLNPFKLNSGQPSDVHGAALRTLALLERARPGILDRRLNTLLERALRDGDAKIRSHALAAAREKPTLSETVMMAVLMCARDHEANVAAHAFSAIANKDKLTRPQWRLFAYAGRMASLSGNVRLRRLAAIATSALLPKAPTKAIAKELRTLCDEFGQDRCYSVRSNAVVESA